MIIQIIQIMMMMIIIIIMMIKKNVNLIFSICFWIFPACGFCAEEWLNPHSSSVYIYTSIFVKMLNIFINYDIVFKTMVKSRHLEHRLPKPPGSGYWWRGRWKILPPQKKVRQRWKAKVLGMETWLGNHGSKYGAFMIGFMIGNSSN